MFSRQQGALAAVFCLLGAVVAWAPNRPLSTTKPPSVKQQHPIVLKDINPQVQHLAVVAVVAASLFLTPLPSHAAAAATDGVKVDVEGNSLIIKLDLPELKANAIQEAFNAGKLKATLKEVTPLSNVESTNKENEQPKAAAQQVKEERQQKVEASKVVEKPRVEKVSESMSDAAPVNKSEVAAQVKKDESNNKKASESKNEAPVQVEKDEPADKKEHETPATPTTITPVTKKNEASNAASEKKETGGAADGQTEKATKQAPVVVVESTKKEEPKPVEQKKETAVKDDSSEAATEKKDDAPTPLFQMIREAVMPEEPKATEQSKEDKRDESYNKAAPKEEKTDAAAPIIVEKKQEPAKVEAPKAAEQPKEEAPAPAPLFQMIREAVKPEESTPAEQSQEKVKAAAPIVEKKQEPTKTEAPKAAEKPEPSQEEKKDTVQSKIAPKEEKVEAAAPIIVEKKQEPRQVDEPKVAEQPKEDKAEESKTGPSPAPLFQTIREAAKPEEATTTEQEEKKDDMQAPKEEKVQSPAPVVEKKEEPTKAKEPKAVEAPKEDKKEEPKKEPVVVVPEKQSEKEPVAEAPKVVVEQVKKEIVPDIAKERSAPLPAAPPSVMNKKTEAQKETKETDSSSVVSKPVSPTSPPVKRSEDETPILNKLWNDFASKHVEPSEQAAMTSYGNIPYWERPAFRIPLQKKMDGKGAENLVFSNLEVARASAVGLGLASAANFMNLRPATRKQGGKEKETRKGDMKAKREAPPVNPFVNRVKAKTNGDAVSNEVTPNRFVEGRKAAGTAGKQPEKRSMPARDPSFVAGSTGNDAQPSGSSGPNGGYLDELSDPTSSSSGAPPTFPPSNGSGTPMYPDQRPSEPFPSSGTPDSVTERSSNAQKTAKQRKAPGIIYYSPEQKEAAARRASELEAARRAQSNDESRAPYSDGFSNEVNGYNRKEPSISPFPKDERTDSY